MLNRDLMKRADDRTLEQREHALGGVRVNVAAHVLILAVIHCFVLRVLVLDALIRFPLVGHNPFGVGADFAFDEGVQRLAVAPLFEFKADAAAALNSGEHHSLARRSSASDAT